MLKHIRVVSRKESLKLYCLQSYPNLRPSLDTVCLNKLSKMEKLSNRVVLLLPFGLHKNFSKGIFFAA